MRIGELGVARQTLSQKYSQVIRVFRKVQNAFFSKQLNLPHGNHCVKVKSSPEEVKGKPCARALSEDEESISTLRRRWEMLRYKIVITPISIGYRSFFIPRSSNSLLLQRRCFRMIDLPQITTAKQQTTELETNQSLVVMNVDLNQIYSLSCNLRLEMLERYLKPAPSMYKLLHYRMHVPIVYVVLIKNIRLPIILISLQKKSEIISIRR